MEEQANAALLLGLSKEALKLAQDTEQHPRVSPPDKAIMVLYQAIDNSLLGQTRAALLQADRAARLFSELKEPLARSWSFPSGDLVEKSFAERRAVRELLIALKKSDDEPSTQLKTAARLVREFAATLERGCNADLAESEIE